MSREVLRAELFDFESALARATTERLRSLLGQGIATIQKELAVLEPPAPASEGPSDSSPTAKAQAPTQADGSPLPFTDIKSYSWDESDSTVKIYLTLEGCGKIDPQNVSLECQNNPTGFLFKLLAPKRLALRVSPLKQKIVPSKCTVKCKTDSVVIFLAKESNGKWFDLIEKMPLAKKKEPAPLEDKDSEPGDPGASIMKMMKQLYDEGDDEMKRTIAKAWTEQHNKQAQGDPDL